MKPKQILREVADNWTDPDWWRHVAYPFAVRKAVLQPYYSHAVDHDGVRLMEEDWDNLLVLDACREDMFRELYDGPGELSAVHSQGAATPGFLRRNFGGETHYDTVYVTANPQVNVHLDDVFHDVINVWEDDWDDDLNTVPPDAMKRATLEAYERYPDKRLIAHFVQPHYPFIGEYGQQLLDDQAGVELSRRMAEDEADTADEDHVWLKLRKGEVTEAEARRAYYENLEITLPHVRELLDRFEEKTVVTSDHGNVMGAEATPLGVEVYGHPAGVYVEDLVRVPWVEVPGARKETVAEEPQARPDPTEDVDERLEHLGYA